VDTASVDLAPVASAARWNQLVTAAAFLPVVVALAYQAFFVVRSAVDCSGNCFELKKLDPTTFAITHVASSFSLLSFDYQYPMNGLAFVGTSNAYVGNPAAGIGIEYMDYRELTKSGGSWSPTYQSYGFLNPATHGMAYDSASTLIYTAEGYDEADLTADTSKLTSVASPYTGSATKTAIGTVTGYPGMVGITFAPAANLISSPSQPVGAKRFEPIRQLLLY
jgi:hypothetical protein